MKDLTSTTYETASVAKKTSTLSLGGQSGLIRPDSTHSRASRVTRSYRHDPLGFDCNQIVSRKGAQPYYILNPQSLAFNILFFHILSVDAGLSSSSFLQASSLALRPQAPGHFRQLWAGKNERRDSSYTTGRTYRSRSISGSVTAARTLAGDSTFMMMKALANL